MYLYKIISYYNYNKKLNQLLYLYIIHVKNYMSLDSKMIKQIYKFNEHQKMELIIALNDIIITLFSNIDNSINDNSINDNICNKISLNKKRSSSKMFCFRYNQ